MLQLTLGEALKRVDEEFVMIPFIYAYEDTPTIFYIGQALEPAERETGEDWETQFDREFYEGVYGCAESDGEYYPLEEKMKQFIRGLLERSK